MTFVTDDDLPLQDPRLPPYQMPNQVNPIRYGATMFGLEALQMANNFTSLVAAQNKGVEHFLDGMFNEGVQSSASMTPESFEEAKKAFPGLNFGQDASKEQIVAALNRQEIDNAIDYFGRNATPGIASEAAGFIGGVGVGFLDAPAMLSAKAAFSVIGRGSRLMAESMAESAVSRLGGSAQTQAQQLIANNAGKIAFAQTAGAVTAFTGVSDLERQGVARLSGVTTDTEENYRITDSVLSAIVGSLTFGVMGVAGEKFTGKMVDKSIFKTPEEKAAEREEIQAGRAEFKAQRKAERQAERADMMDNIQMMAIEPGDPAELFKKTVNVVRSFFQQNKPDVDQNTMDNASLHLEYGRDVHEEFLNQVNQHDAWQKLQAHLDQHQITPDEFIEVLDKQTPELLKAVEDNPGDMDAFTNYALNQSLKDMAGKLENEVMPKQGSKAAFMENLKKNRIEFEEESPIDFEAEPETKTLSEKLSDRVNAYSVEEIQSFSDKGNPYSDFSIRMREALENEQIVKEFVSRFGNDVLDALETGEITQETFMDAVESLGEENTAELRKMLDMPESQLNYFLDNMLGLIEDLRHDAINQEGAFTPEQLEQAVNRQFELIKAQIIRADQDAFAWEHKISVLKNAVQQMDNSRGEGIKQGLLAILDRSLFRFEGANAGTYRKMNLAENHFKGNFQYELARDGILPFWNDINSSVELGRAIYADQLKIDMSGFSEPAKKAAKVVNKYYKKAIEELANVGVLISELPGRIHYKWNNPHRMLRLTRAERKGLTKGQRIDKAFEKWFDFKYPLLDLEKSFGRQREAGENAIDITDKAQVKAVMRESFDKMTNPQTYKDPIYSTRGRTNLLNKRNRERVYHFKTPEGFIKYNEKYGGGNTQNSVINELSGMFKEAMLIKDWGVEPEKMLADVKEYAKDLPGWREYQLGEKKDMDTPDRLMRLMRYGAAKTFGSFGEVIRNLKSWESITKLGNLIFLNATDSLTAANAVNRLGVPMFESIGQGLKETFARYTPEERQEYLRMFNVARDQYFGSQFRHFEGDGMNNFLTKAIRLSHKLTGTQNSEYSNIMMVAKVLSNHMGTGVKEMAYKDVQPDAKLFMDRYGIGENEWNTLKHAVRDYKGNSYLEWDTVAEIPDKNIRAYLKNQGIKNPTAERIDIARRELADKYRLMMQDQYDDAVNRRSLTESDTIRLKQRPDQPHVVNDVINGAMLFKTYGYLWIKRHIGDRLYGRGADSYRVNAIQGNADWHGLVKLMGMSFAMEYAISQIKQIVNHGEFNPLTAGTAFDAFTSSLGPVAYLSQVDGSNLTSSIARIIAGPIGSDAERVARIVTQFERGFWKGDYTTAQVNAIKMIESQFGGFPGLKPALHALIFDNLIQSRKGHRTGRMVDNLQASQEQESSS